MIKFRHLIWIMIAAAGLMLSLSPSHAQKPDLDQPGLFPDDSIELDSEYRSQMVYYRTSEAPGTIIISTTDRHLYLIQGNGRAIRYGIGKEIIDPVAFIVKAKILSLRRYLVSEVRVLYANFLT